MRKCFIRCTVKVLKYFVQKLSILLRQELRKVPGYNVNIEIAWVSDIDLRGGLVIKVRGTAPPTERYREI